MGVFLCEMNQIPNDSDSQTGKKERKTITHCPYESGPAFFEIPCRARMRGDFFASARIIYRRLPKAICIYLKIYRNQ